MVVFRAQIIRFREEKLTTQRQPSIEKIRLGHVKKKILALGAVLDSQPEFLTAAGKGGPIEQIEIALRQFREPNQLINGAETGTETK